MVGIMTSGGETTLEEEIIYNPEISKLIAEAEDKIQAQLDRNPEPPWAIKNALESLVYRAVREWTGE